MKWLKSALAGIIGSLVMFIFLMIGINVTGFAPFNVPPSAALLTKLGLAVGPLPLIVHFGYGAFWSIVFLSIYKHRADIKKGLFLSVLLWLILMVVYSPIIGWGVFGFGASAGELAVDAPLYLGSAIKYSVMTLLLHLVYGAIIGWLNPAWVDIGEGESILDMAT